MMPLQAFPGPMIHKHTGNIILIVGSSECGKSSILAKVLLQVFKRENGFITTFMSPSYDSLPIQELVMKNISGKRKEKKAKKNPENPTGFVLKLKLNKNYGEADKVREFRFVLALDDEIDIGGNLIRKVCLTWRNKGISWVQLVQDITCLDCAVRNSAPIVFFGHMNFPARRRQICEEYLSPSEKRFILMNHRLRKAFHIDTHTGICTELPELSSTHDMQSGFYELQAALPVDGQKKEDGEKKKHISKDSGISSKSALPGSGSKRKAIEADRNIGTVSQHHRHHKKHRAR